MHSIWAIATNTIRQTLRMKIAAVFMVLLVGLLPVMAFSMTGDGTLKGRLQSFVSYGLSLTSLLLCLMTIAASTYSLSSDIRDKQIYTVLTKPIRRFQLLLGKLLGIVLLDAALLVLFSGLVYGLTRAVTRFSDVSEQELKSVENEFLTARAGLKPVEADVTRKVTEAYEQLEKSGRLQELFRGLSKQQILTRLTNQKNLESRAAAVGEELVWEFDNVRLADPNESLFIRFKYDVSMNPPDLQVCSQWFVGDDRQIKYGEKHRTPIYTFVRKDLIRTAHEMEVPAGAVAEDGYLAVAFFNVPLNNTVVIFPLEDGLEVLYKADTFTRNFVRAAMLIFLRLVFLAVLGTLSATFLSFPVCILLCLAIFFTGTISGFVIDSFDYLSDNMGAVYSYALGPVIRLLPEFDKFDPAGYLVSARLVSWVFLAKAAGMMIFLRGTVLLLFAVLIFSRREIARITV